MRSSLGSVYSCAKEKLHQTICLTSDHRSSFSFLSDGEETPWRLLYMPPPMESMHTSA